MSRPIIYCRSDEDIGDAICIVEDEVVRRLPVINRTKRIVGMQALGN